MTKLVTITVYVKCVVLFNTYETLLAVKIFTGYIDSFFKINLVLTRYVQFSLGNSPVYLKIHFGLIDRIMNLFDRE